MRPSRLGQLLLVLGAAVGSAAVVGLVMGIEPATLPPAVLNIAVYKLTFAAAAGLLAAGAVTSRYARRDARQSPDTAKSNSAEQLALSEGAAPDQASTSAKHREPHGRDGRTL